MCKTNMKNEDIKIKVSKADIICQMVDGKPYYSIKYFDISKNKLCVGFSSYNLDYVISWKRKYFEIV